MREQGEGGKANGGGGEKVKQMVEDARSRFMGLERARPIPTFCCFGLDSMKTSRNQSSVQKSSTGVVLTRGRRYTKD